MKKSFVALLALASLVSVTRFALAADDISAHKAEVLSEIDQKIAKMTEHRGCVNAATTKDAMHDCHEKMKSWRESEHKEHLEKRRARIDEKIQKLDAQKKALAPK